MKTTDEEIKKIINEILSEKDGSNFGQSTVSKTDAVKNLKQRTKDAASQSGVDNVERGIIQKIENNLTELASLTNLKTGRTFSFLKKINLLMEKEIQRLKQGANQDEK